MTLATLPLTSSQGLIADRFDFGAAELMGMLRKASLPHLTGYWTIQFDRMGPEPITWYLSLGHGKIVFSGCRIPRGQDYIKVLLQYLGPTKKSKVAQKLEASRSDPLSANANQLQDLLKHWISAGLVETQDIATAIKTHLLNEFDVYFAYQYGGTAYFTPDSTLDCCTAIAGIDASTMFLESIKRRVQWTGLKSSLPSPESVLSLTPKAYTHLQDYQRTTLEILFREKQPLVKVAQTMGKDALVLAQSFVSLVQQGILSVESQRSGIPVEAAQTVHAQATQKQSSPFQRSAKSASPEIFIVDDSPVLVRQFKTLVERWGYQVKSTNESVSAVRKILQARPSVIFLDVNMPQVSGFELIKQIRRESSLSGIPVVMLTAEKSVSNQWRAQWASCKFMAKPKSVDDIEQFRKNLKGLLHDLANVSSTE